VINPGTDTALALGLMHVILCEGLEDREYIAACTHGFEELREHALRMAHSPERVAEVTGIAAETIVRLAREYAAVYKTTGRPAVIRLNYGVQRSENGGPAGHADLKPAKKYRLDPGQAGIYQDGRIHSIDYPAKARFVRVTGVDLEHIPRHKFDIATGVATRMEARTTG